jgi:hypothetical protein
MGDPLFLLAAAGLSLSGIVSAIKLIDWFLHSDPKLIAQTGRWAGLGFAIISVPLLIGLLLAERWTAAIALAAAMLLGFALYGPRILATLMPRRLTPDWSPVSGRGSAPPPEGDPTVDRQLVERSIAVLEDYLRQSAGLPKPGGTVMRTNATTSANGNGHDGTLSAPSMSQAEALEVLGLTAGATEWDIADAHRRLVQMIHPDRGGSHYLTVKINQAKDVLLGKVSTPDVKPPPKQKRRRTPRRPELDASGPTN